MTVRRCVVLVMAILALLVGHASIAQPYEYHVYIDSDLRSSTGCTVSGGGQTFEGADYRLTATVSGNPPVVTTRTLTPCSGGSFGSGGTLGGNYPVGLNNGVPLSGGNFADVIELSLPRAQMPGVEPLVRIGFGAVSASGSVDVLYTANGVVGGPPMVIGSPAVIPTLGFVGGLLLALALATLALRTLKHNRRLAQMLLLSAFFSAGFAAWAANFIDDGQVGDWAGVSPVGVDVIGDPVPNLSATDIVAGFAADEDRILHFRIDVVDAENRPPIAAGDAYATQEDSPLNIAAPGVLGNDSDPDGSPITAQLVSGPTRGTLVLNANGSFSYTPNANVNGSDSFTYNAFDGQVASLTPATVTVAITAVNDVPVFTAGNSQTVLEDVGAQIVSPWASGIDDGDPEVTQNLSFEITANSNAALFSVAPTVSSTGALSYTPAANANGSATITLRLNDDGGTANGGINQSATQAFTITVNPVNDAPTLTAVSPPTVNEDAGAQTVANWAAFNPGPPDESGQTVVGYQISAISNPALFAVPPAVANNGTLTYTPAANANGSSTFVARVQDSGGTANGGIDLSVAQTFTITVSAINDAPSFTAGPNQTVNEDAGGQVVSPWATALNDGDPEVTQALSFVITNNSNAALFSTVPSVSSTGVLSYTPAANANGSATITLRIQDDGSNTPPNVNQSATQTFTITVTPVNDAPSFAVGTNQTVPEDAAAQTVNPWATAISAGPADEAAQTLTFNVTGNTNAALFSTSPAVSPTGVLTYTPAANTSGVATITLSLSDNGSNTPPDVNISAAQTFTITVDAVNDAPVNTVPGTQTTGDTVPVVFSTANTNAISIVDLDAAAGVLQVSFGTGAAANGTLTLANPGGALTSLTGNGTEQVIATGTLTALNAALNGPSGSLTYTPVAGTSAARTITMITNDQGNTGSGGAQIDTDTVTVNVDAAPIVTSTPASGATIANNAAIVVNFNEPVNVIAGITLNCGGPNLITGGATGSAVTTLNLSYTAPLPAGSCTLTVPNSSVADVDTIDPPNNPAATFTATFTVDAAPALVSSTPAAAAVVNTAQIVSFTYNEPVTDVGAAITLNCGGSIAGAVSGSGTATLTFTPTNPLPAGASCTATAVAAQINDADAFDPPQNPPANSTIAFSVDAAPAFVSSVPVTDGAVVGTGQTVSFTFDENVSNLGAAITLNCGGAVAGAITGSGTPTLTFTPTNPLTAGASCTATAVAAQIGDSDTIDPPQNPAANVVRTFSVDTAPTVAASVPANGAINVDIASNLTVNFSEAVTFPAGAFTLECPAGAAIPFAVSGSGTNQATIDPTPAPLPINTLCVLTIDAAQLQDVDTADPPNVGAGITTVSFTTVNDNSPSVTSAEVEIGNIFTALPLGAGLASDANTNIRLTFSEAVSVAGNWASLACASSGTQDISAGLAVTDADPVFTLNPGTDLTPGESCTLTVFATQVTDDDALDPPDTLSADFVATFTVDAAPSVSTVVPANAATGVAVNATVTVNFSEPVTIGSAAAFSLECPAATPLGFTVTTPAVLPATASSFTVTPASNLPGSAVCVVTVFAAEVSDADLADPPNTMLANFSSTFTTVDTAPSVTSTNPANGATSVNPTSPITINFSESVNFSTLANAANSSFDLECPGGTPANFTVATASPASTVVLNPDDNAIAGSTCALTVVASGISDVDLIDPPDNMAANFSASFSFGAIANNDSYTVTPHLTLNIPTVGVQGGGTAANDLLGAGAVTGFGFAPACTGTAPGVQLDAGAANGRLTLNANGSFAYEPPAALAAVTRTFCYTVTGGDTANIDFTVENQARVWFVDAAAAGGGNGTQARPFNALTGAGSFNAVAADGDGDTIYIEGDHTGGLTLRAGQRMIGGGSTATIGTFSGVVPIAGSAFPAVSGSAPVITCSGVTCLVLNGSGAANTHSLRGFTIGDSGAAGTDIGGTNFGTLTVAELTLTGSGTTLNLATGTLNGTFLGLNANAGSGSLTLSAVGGTWSVQNQVNITGVLIGAFSIANMPAGGGVTLTGGMNCALGNGSISLTGNSSPINLGNVLLNTTTSMTVSGSTGVTTVTGGSLTTPVNTLLVTNSAVDITLSTLTSSGGAPGPNVSATNFTGSINIASGNISNSQAGNTAVVLTNNAGTFSFGGQVAKNTAGRAIDISGGTGNVTFSGIVSCFTSCGTGAGNEGLRVTGRTGGTVAFSGGTKQFSSTATNPAVVLTTNTGGTVNFTGGGLAITTTSGTGFTATGGGTVTVQGAGNTVSTTTGTAVNVNATTIGGGGMTFESINSTAASANTAIVLNNTGAGAFSVTGTGAAGSGGTISNKTVDAVQLNTTGGLVSLDRMIIEDIGDMAGGFDIRSGHDAIQGLAVNGGLSLTGTTIRRISDQAIHGGTQGSPDTGTAWSGLTLSGVTIENTNRYHVAGTGDANNEGTVRILGIRGTVNVTNSTFSLGAQPLDLEVTGSTLNLTATGNTFDRSYKEFTSGVRASIGNHCIDVRVLAGATANVVIGDRANPALANNFLNCRLGSIRIVNQPGAGANTDAIIARNNFRVNDHSSGIGGNFDFPMGGALVWNLGSGTIDTIVENNLFETVTRASGGNGQLSLIAEGGPLQALVQNNTFDRPGEAPWWVQSRASAASVLTARFVGNQVIRGAFPCTIDLACGGGYFGPGLRALADAQQGATLNFTMENNVMARHDTGFDPGQTVEVRSLNNGGGGTVCSSFVNNRSPDGYSLEQLAGTVRTVAAAGSCAAGSPSASCQSVFQNNGNQGGAGVLTTLPPLVNVLGTVTVNATACPVPAGLPF